MPRYYQDITTAEENKKVKKRISSFSLAMEVQWDNNPYPVKTILLIIGMRSEVIEFKIVMKV